VETAAIAGKAAFLRGPPPSCHARRYGTGKAFIFSKTTKLDILSGFFRIGNAYPVSMKHETGAQGEGQTALHSLIPLADFKAILGIDDREDALSRYCLITATYTIEQYCKRRLLRRKNTDCLTFTGEYIFTLREYPIRRMLAVWTAKAEAALSGEPLSSPENLVDPKHYYCLPDEGIHEDIPFSLSNLKYSENVFSNGGPIKVFNIFGSI
jgi:hypothetical protein